jgi:DNA-binding transcriptional MerR regulator
VTLDNVTATVYIVRVDEQGRRYSLEELAGLAGVTRRTVRFYIQAGLVPAPLGVGRGSHYDRTHLERLLEVRSLQESGRSLDDIKLGRAAGREPEAPGASTVVGIPRTAWRRLEIAPGVELHLASDIRLPPSQRLDELVEWCRRHLSRNPEGKE